MHLISCCPYGMHLEPARPPQPCPATPLPLSFGRKGQAVQARAAHSRWGEALNELGRMQVRICKPWHCPKTACCIRHKHVHGGQLRLRRRRKLCT